MAKGKKKKKDGDGNRKSGGVKRKKKSYLTCCPECGLVIEKNKKKKSYSCVKCSTETNSPVLLRKGEESLFARLIQEENVRKSGGEGGFLSLFTELKIVLVLVGMGLIAVFLLYFFGV